MPVPTLVSVSTQDNYVDALTVVFQSPRTAFSLNVFNARILYKLLYVPSELRQSAYLTENLEHDLAPSLSTFRDPPSEGLPPNSLYAGIQIKSAITGTPAVVSVT